MPIPVPERVPVEEMPCLFARQAHCTVHLRAPGKGGQVPYRDWPEGVKGHVVTRTPPEGYLVA